MHAKGTEQTYYLTNMDEEERVRYIAHQHVTHFSDNKHHNKVIDGMTVDIGTDFDWTDSVYKEERKTRIDGRDWVDKIRSEQEKAISEQASASGKLVIPIQRNREGYDVDQLSKEQQDIVYTAVDTIIKFLNNDPSYKPMHATIMGNGGTGKSFVINANIGMARKLTSCNDTV